MLPLEIATSQSYHAILISTLKHTHPDDITHKNYISEQYENFIRFHYTINMLLLFLLFIGIVLIFTRLQGASNLLYRIGPICLHCVN